MIAEIEIFGETSAEFYKRIRDEIAQANASDEVQAIVLLVDCCGGDSNGVWDVADDIYYSPKPIYAYVNGYCASGGYWLASQSKVIVASRGSFIGSIGTYSVLQDNTAELAAKGIKNIVVSNTDLKGAGADGAIDEKVINATKAEIDQFQEVFNSDIQRARDEVNVKEVATGEVWIAAVAYEKKLIDGIGSYESFLGYIASDLNSIE